MMMMDEPEKQDQALDNNNNNNNNNSSGNDSSSDDDNENNNNNNNVAVENFQFAADDATIEVPYPQKHVIILPKHLMKLVNEASNTNNGNNSVQLTTSACASPLRVFKAPHPRHGEQVLFLAASYLSTSSNTKRSNEDGADDQEETPFLELNDANTSSTDNHQRVRLVRIFELQSRKPHHSTWFIGENVEPQSPLLIASPLHPAFFALYLAVSDAVAHVGGKDSFENLMMNFVPTQEGEEDSNNNSTNVSERFRLRASDDWTMVANQVFFLKGAQNKNFSSTTPFSNLWDGYLKQGFDTVCEEVKRGDSSFYRFSPQKTTDFLKTRMIRLLRSRSFDHLVFGSSTSSASNNDQQDRQQQSSSSDESSKTKSILEERAAGLILEYVTKDLPHHHARRWTLGTQRATAVANKKVAPSAFSKEDVAARYGGDENDDLFGVEAQKKRKTEEEKKNASKSMNVKKLEKAGKPKGTPSVASFFGVKKKE